MYWVLSWYSHFTKLRQQSDRLTVFLEGPSCANSGKVLELAFLNNFETILDTEYRQPLRSWSIFTFLETHQLGLLCTCINRNEAFYIKYFFHLWCFIEPSVLATMQNDSNRLLSTRHYSRLHRYTLKWNHATW